MAETRVDFILPGEKHERFWDLTHKEPLEVTGDGVIRERGMLVGIAYFPPEVTFRLVPLKSEASYDQAIDNARLRAEVEHHTAYKIAHWLRQQYGKSFTLESLADLVADGAYR